MTFSKGQNRWHLRSEYLHRTLRSLPKGFPIYNLRFLGDCQFVKKRRPSILQGIVCAWLILVLGNAYGQSANNAQISDLLARMKSDWPNSCVQDNKGNLIEAHLTGKYSIDSNLFLISQINSIQTLYIQGRYHGKGMTREGLTSLSKLTNLVDLHLACTFEMPPELFLEISKLTTVRKLDLYGAYPPKSEYVDLCHMTNLEELQMTCCNNFGREQFNLITNLTNLKNLKLEICDTNHDTNILASLKNLTNAAIYFYPPKTAAGRSR